MTVNTHSLARSIKAKTGTNMKEIDAILRALYDTLEEELDAGQVIKLGDMLKLELEDKPARQAWDGVHKRSYTIPDKRRLVVKRLSRVTKLENKEINND
jgi:nucleoid DNA-binding protein